MAQGLGKITGARVGTKKRKSAASQKHTKKLNKGRKSFAAKGRKCSLAKREVETSKAINRKNEAHISAKALSAGSKFFLADIKEVGKVELKKQNIAMKKVENKSTKLSDRLKDQLKKMGHDISK
mmetsp:Transcript_18561/g.26116  ORF Transcript_18561/g.26116 Transcript_18561/m.26116 type:complete len:124 (+) Transcript_18561:105-476(+)|eukprot:CAMPEP_0184862880 /NCGR_PEP_ID=MMETSP0580-20130426/8127_1 /TAXON_ID=1118495 /ORGANISM="Dactyliosolen fragilissimus" /LENGTH=123 /DNA_ID=CAMNT_0027360897 /DNA_START=67 /DNA_END=438 /DNA_ORIENTATION=+